MRFVHAFRKRRKPGILQPFDAAEILPRRSALLDLPILELPILFCKYARNGAKATLDLRHVNRFGIAMDVINENANIVPKHAVSCK